MFDSDGITIFNDAVNKAENSITTPVKLVDDNLSYYSKLVDKVNRQVLYPLHSLGVGGFIKSERLLTYASLNKLAVGCPHEPHSHLLENNVKAPGIKLWIDKSGGVNTVTLINDYAK